jgi:histidinol dehydrogenase
MSATTTSVSNKRIDDLDEARHDLSRRGGYGDPELSSGAMALVREVFGEELGASEVVARVVDDVRDHGDEAVRKYTRAFDHRDVENAEVPRAAWEAAWNGLDDATRDAITTAVDRVAAFHREQLRTSWFSTSDLGLYGQVVRPLERVGVYTPGGQAAYPSSLIMTAVPAKVAGVEEVIVAAPPGGDGDVSPLILAAALAAGVDRVFAIGGAQAIAALAYGTESVPRVDKILGPGNIFVALAKQRVFGAVAIDQIAGPTETLVIADDSADLTLVAADLIAQAEHDQMASAILITTSSELADRVPAELSRQLATLPRADVVGASLAANGRIVVAPSLEVAVDLANTYAPEHLCLLTRDPWALVPLVKHAGGIFVGEASPEALGDYTAGPSHVMPTGGSARFSSPLNSGEFFKVINLAAGNRQAIDQLAAATTTLARAEGLEGHARAIDRRLGKTFESE